MSHQNMGPLCLIWEHNYLHRYRIYAFIYKATNDSKRTLYIFDLTQTSFIQSWDASDGKRKMLLARVNVFSHRAAFALNATAPDHLTVARFVHNPRVGVVTPAAAQHVTVCSAVTQATTGAVSKRRGVTITGRLLQKHEVALLRTASHGILTSSDQLTFSRRLICRHDDLDGWFVFWLQLSADLVEVRELPPTGFDGAGSGNAVAFAGGVDTVPHHLWMTKWTRENLVHLDAWASSLLRNNHKD
jgi:hypothetical protein